MDALNARNDLAALPLNEKETAPLLSEDSLRPTKKVRIRADGDGDGSCSANSPDVIGRDGDMPSIEFSSWIKEVLVKGMERTVILKLLGDFYFATFDLDEDYMKALTGGPWMIFGAYLMIQPWSLDFDASGSSISKVVAWVRIPGPTSAPDGKKKAGVAEAQKTQALKVKVLDASCDAIAGPNKTANQVQGPVAPSIAMDESSKASIFLSSAFQALETHSSLDSTKHTVVKMHSTRQVLEEVNLKAVDGRTDGNSSLDVEVRDGRLERDEGSGK
ncbi:hypothetical protein K1719_002152 [Acacia pycnantha]|nr:hypothetical protein K1719_002152 [Acacia pycnantha]